MFADVVEEPLERRPSWNSSQCGNVPIEAWEMKAAEVGGEEAMINTPKSWVAYARLYLS